MRCLPFALTLALALAGCGSSAPDGQVVASVNGDEITRAQLNAALAAGGVQSVGKDTQGLRNAVLDGLIAQQLVAQEARREDIDKSQDYLLAMHGAEDQILSNLLSRKVLQSLRTPYAKDVEQFVKDNPSRFANRTILTLDRIRYPASRLDASKLADAHSLADVEHRLSEAGIRMERDRATIDTAGISPKLHDSLMALPAGDPFIVTEGDLTLVSTIVSSQPAPITGEAASQMALQVIRQQEGRAALAKQLETLRKGARIEYQPGFAAPKHRSGIDPAGETPASAAASPL